MRNAPTVINAAFNETQFWDGRSPDLEDQAQHPFVNTVEMGLPNREPILKIVRSDPAYANALKAVFGIEPAGITIQHVSQAIAAFERTVVAGNSPFDRWYFGGDKTAMNESAVRGCQVFLREGSCVSCHTIEQDHALFSEHHFHNVGVGINEIQDQAPGKHRSLRRTLQADRPQGDDRYGSFNFKVTRTMLGSSGRFDSVKPNTWQSLRMVLLSRNTSP